MGVRKVVADGGRRGGAPQRGCRVKFFVDFPEERVTSFGRREGERRHEFGSSRNPRRWPRLLLLTINEKIMQTWNDIVGITRGRNAAPPRRVERTEAEWRAQLSPEQFHVTRQHGTERAFSSEMCSLFEPGKYACVCCATVLFDSAEKFESGTGWPSFTQPISPDVVAYHGDNSYGMLRVETLCNVCDAHLGHVFPDGPAPGGLRYCMNAVALEKVGPKG